MERPALIGLIGCTGAGKASVGDVLVRCGYRRVAFSDKVRELAARLHTLRASRDSAVDAVGMGYALLVDDDVVAQVRQATEDVLGPDVWLDACLPRVSSPFGRSAFSPEEPVVVVDVRSVNEARRVRNLGGVIWRVIRPGVGPADEDEARQLADIQADATVCNTGDLSDLHAVVQYMLDRWGEPLPDLLSEPAEA